MSRRWAALGVVFGVLFSSGVLGSVASADPLDPAQLCVVRVHSSSALSVNNATTTLLVYDVEDTDECGMFDAGVDDAVVVAPFDGSCEVGYTVDWAVDANGFRRVLIRAYSGDATVGHDTRMAVSGASTSMIGSTTIPVAEGDEMKIVAYQTSGGSLNVTTGPFFGQFPTLWAVCHAQGSAVGGGSLDDTAIVAGLYQLSQQIQGASGFAAVVAWLFGFAIFVLVVFAFARVR